MQKSKLPYEIKKEPFIIQEDIEALLNFLSGISAFGALLLFIL